MKKSNQLVPRVPLKANVNAPPYPPMWGEGSDVASVLLPGSSPPADDVAPPLTLDDAVEKLRLKVSELVTAGPARVSGLNVEIQKLRIICMVLREIEMGVSDPNTYKELSLMNRMLTGKDLEAEAERQQTGIEETAATAALENRGIKAESASRILRALTSVLAAHDKGDDDDTEPPDPPA